MGNNYHNYILTVFNFDPPSHWGRMYSCNLGMSGLLDINSQSMRAEGVYIRLTKSVHVTTLYIHTYNYIG